MALRSDGSPWVAQRVWAMPVPPWTDCSLQSLPSSATLPRRRTCCSGWLALNTATPAESATVFQTAQALYQDFSHITLGDGPTMPHIDFSLKRKTLIRLDNGLFRVTAATGRKSA